MEETVKNDVDQEFLLTRTLANNVNQRSELAQEIMTDKPDFLETWALYLFIGFLILILGFTWWVKYPDVVEVRAVLSATNAPKEIITKQEGRIVKLFVHNNEDVKKNETIGYIESTANYEEVIELSRDIDRSIHFLGLNKPDEINKIFAKSSINLGELQVNYQQFITAWQQYNDYKNNGFYHEKRNSLFNDIRSLDSARLGIQSQKRLTEKDLQLAEESYDMNKTLLDQKVLTKEEFRTQTSRYVNKQLALPVLNNSLLDNSNQKRAKTNEVHQLDHDLVQEQVVFSQTLQSLKSQVDLWISKFIIRAPIGGKIYFTIPLQENQFLSNNKLLGYITPKESDFYAESVLPQNNFGKIDTGLTVQLRFDAYPYQEVGFVEGKLNYISKVPSDSGFRATIKLNNGLVTNNHFQIVYKSGLKSQALIITKNMRLLERVYYNVVKSFSVAGKNAE